MQDYLRSNTGRSMMRLSLAVILVISVLILLLCCMALVVEMFKPISNYEGIAAIIGGVLGTDALALAAKALQKKYEHGKEA